MSTILSDKAEELADHEGLHAELRRWKDEVLAALDEHFGQAGSITPQTGKALASVPDAVRKDAMEFVYRIEDSVIEHPVKALAIAAGAGFLLGVLWSR